MANKKSNTKKDTDNSSINVENALLQPIIEKKSKKNEKTEEPIVESSKKFTLDNLNPSQLKLYKRTGILPK